MPDTITVDEMRALIKEEKIKPSRLFGIDALAEDPIVKGITKEAIQTELTHRKRLSTRFEEVDEDREKEKGAWEKEKKEKDEELKKKDLEIAKIKSAALFDTKTKERKLDAKQIKFIETKRGGFEPEDPESLDKEVDKFMDSTLDEYKKTADIFGIKTETTKEEKKPGSEPADEEDEEGDASHIPD